MRRRADNSYGKKSETDNGFVSEMHSDRSVGLLEQVGGSGAKSQQGAQGLRIDHQRAALVIAAAVTAGMAGAATVAVAGTTIAGAGRGQQVRQ